MWKPNTAHFLSDHHRPRFHSAALLNCKKNNSSCHGCSLVCSFPVGTSWNRTLSFRMWCLILMLQKSILYENDEMYHWARRLQWVSDVANSLICVFLSFVQHGSNKKRKKHFGLKKSLWAGKWPDGHRKTCDSLMGIGEGFPRRASEHPLLSLVTLLCLAPTLLWMTTTLRLSALNQVSMALQMLQILSRAGAWWSGQPKSNTWETPEPHSQNEAQLRSGQRARRLIYLWIELTDVATLFTQVEELKEIKTNKELKKGGMLFRSCS